MGKILIITLEYPPQIGGIASYVYNMAAHLKPAEVVICAPKIAGGAEFDVNNGWKTIRRKPYWSFFWPHWLRLVWQVWRAVKKEKITMIHVHHVLPVGYAAYLMKKIRKIPYFIFFHGTDAETGTTGKWKRKQVAKICREADKIIVNSQFVKNKLVQRLDGVEGKIKILFPCPGDIFFQELKQEELETMRSQLALTGKKVLLTVARMNEGKGYPRMIRLLPRILERVPNLIWLVIGDGPKKNQSIELAQKYYLQNVIRFLGSVPHNELPKYYRLADLFAVLTHPDESAEEGWGTVFVEAAAMGVPVVAGRAGGVEESVKHLETGLIVDVYQDSAVVSAVSDMLLNSDYAKKMGEAGRARALNEFRWDIQIKQL